MRDRLARHILLTDLVVGLGDTLPASLSSLKVATSPAARDACKELARNWRMRRDVRDSYVTSSRSVEDTLGTLFRRRDGRNRQHSEKAYGSWNNLSATCRCVGAASIRFSSWDMTKALFWP